MSSDLTSAEGNKPEPTFQERGQRGPENAILHNLRKARDRAATLQSDVARLNAVFPEFVRVDKSVESLLVATRGLAKALEGAITTVTRKEAYRNELTLEFGYKMVLDFRRKVPTIHKGRAIEDYVRKHEDQICDAYNMMPQICSMKRHEIDAYRGFWLFTAVLIRRCAIQPYRYEIGRKIFDLRVAGELDDNDAYYLARFLESQSACPEPKYQIGSSHFFALQVEFLAVMSDFNKAIEAMRFFRSNPARQTIDKHDVLKAVFELIFEKFKHMEMNAQEAFAKRPKVFWDHSYFFRTA